MEKPILFNTEMVKAILEGRKTVTRRVIKIDLGMLEIDKNNKDYLYLEDEYGESHHLLEYAPYKVGDILYVRETWFIGDLLDEDESIKERGLVLYKADKRRGDIDYESIKWRPSIHMPKAAARIFLEVTNVRVERLQDITEDGARAEGCIDFYDKIGDGKFEDVLEFDLTAKDAFSELWNSTVNKKDINLYGWDANPWVWVIELKVKEVKN